MNILQLFYGKYDSFTKKDKKVLSYNKNVNVKNCWNFNY